MRSVPSSNSTETSESPSDDTERSERYWEKNFELLIGVTDAEDFATAAGIQRGFGTGAQTHVTFGRNEPALQHFHRSIDALLARSPG